MRDGWKEISLEDLETSGVIKLGRGDVISKKDMEADPGPNPVYSSAENKNGMIGKYAKFMFDEELITWSVDGGGHIFYRPKHKFSVTNIGGWLRILDDKVFSYQFLTYALQRLHKQHSFDWQHKAHPSVIRKLYTRIPLPSLPEQKRIVDLISSVDSYIEALQQQLESAKRSRNAVLHELLTAGGDDWEESSLGRLLTLEYGKPLTDENRDGIGFPVFASAGVVGMHSEPLVSNSPVIVVGRKGTAGAVHWSSTPCFVIDTAYFVKPISDIDLRFLYLLLGFIDLKSVTAQTGVPGLNRDRAYSLKCNVPPKSKQLEVVAIVTQLDDFIDSTQGTINRSQDLRSGLLSDLLSGEHEIPASYDKVMGAA